LQFFSFALFADKLISINIMQINAATVLTMIPLNILATESRSGSIAIAFVEHLVEPLHGLNKQVNTTSASAAYS
jgi:hypothetical protein